MSAHITITRKKYKFVVCILIMSIIQINDVASQNSPAASKLRLKEAVLTGDQKSLDSLIDLMFLRVYSRGGDEDFTLANPVELLQIINTATLKHPNLSINQVVYKALQHAAEAGDFDLGAFISRYNLMVPEWSGDMYFLWTLAEDASTHGGVIPGPDMKLTLQLIARGGNVPAEVIGAVEYVYDCWKSGKNEIFNIADHITSGLGRNYISAKEQHLVDSKLAGDLDKIIRKSPVKVHELLKKAYKTAENYIEVKVYNEEGHDGPGFHTWATESLNKQRKEFIETIDGLLQKRISIPSKKDNEGELNEVYQKVITYVKTHNIHGVNFSITEEEVRSTERLYLPYRDAVIELLQVIRPDISRDNVRIWLNEQRIKNLDDILKLSSW
ncbi:hypothetical protein AGMMS4952_09690 [Spirochaetia bacterium]|nr:hypothetical protein AGMMS4952_09690 [Spirochaetia bacterium]